MRQVIGCFLASVLLGLSSTSVHATPLLFQYTGVIYGVGLFDGATELPSLTFGSEVSGSFLVDRACVDSDPSSTRAFYPNCIRRMQFAGEHSTPPTTNYSYFLVDANPALPIIGSYLNSIDGNVSDVYGVSLQGLSGTLVDDSPNWQALTLSDFAFEPSNFTFQRAIFQGDPQAYQGGPVMVTQYYARFSSLSIRPVPEPGTLVLLGVGLLGLVLGGRRGTRPAVR